MVDKDEFKALNDEFMTAIKEAGAKHFTGQGRSNIEGFDSVLLDEDVRYPEPKENATLTIHGGVYFIPEDVEPEAAKPLYFVDRQSLLREVNEHLNSERERGGDKGEPIELHLQIVPVVNKENQPLKLIDAAYWYAVADARAEGDEEKAQRLIKAMHISNEYLRGEDLPKQDTIRVEAHVEPNHKIGQNMTNPYLYRGKISDVILHDKKGNEIINKVHLQINDPSDPNINTNKTLKKYDISVQNAVISLWAVGNRVITPPQIAKAMGIERPGKPQIDKIQESMKNLITTWVYIDYTQEVRSRGKVGEDEKFIMTGAAVAADVALVLSSNGARVMGYVLLRAPIMYAYGQANKQLLSYPQELLEKLSKAGSLTATNVVLRDTLMQRIARMKYDENRRGKNKMSRNINFYPDPDPKRKRDGFLTEAGIDIKDRDARSRAVKYVLKCLDILKAEGYIKDYDDGNPRSGQKRDHVTIII